MSGRVECVPLGVAGLVEVVEVVVEVDVVLVPGTGAVPVMVPPPFGDAPEALLAHAPSVALSVIAHPAAMIVLRTFDALPIRFPDRGQKCYARYDV